MDRGFLLVAGHWSAEAADVWETHGRPPVVLSTTTSSDLDWLPSSGVDRLKVVGGIGDDSALEASTQLRELSLWTETDRRFDATRLTRLELYEGYDRVGPGVADLPLTWLAVQEYQGRSLQGLPLAHLTYLSLMPARRLRDISGLEAAGRLEYLGLGWAPIEEFSPVGRLDTLRELELVSLRHLTDLAFIHGLRLEGLELQNATRVRDLSPLRSQPSLRSFGLRGRHRLDDPNLAFILDLPAMEIASIEVLPRGGDLSRGRLDAMRQTYRENNPSGLGPDTGPQYRGGFGRRQPRGQGRAAHQACSSAVAASSPSGPRSRRSSSRYR